MSKKEFTTERELTSLAKKFRQKAGKKRAQAAREMGVSQTSIFNAEESPEQGLQKLRMRMIEAYSDYEVTGPIFLLGLKGKAKAK